MIFFTSAATAKEVPPAPVCIPKPSLIYPNSSSKSAASFAIFNPIGFLVISVVPETIFCESPILSIVTT